MKTKRKLYNFDHDKNFLLGTVSLMNVQIKPLIPFIYFYTFY